MDRCETPDSTQCTSITIGGDSEARLAQSENANKERADRVLKHNAEIAAERAEKRREKDDRENGEANRPSLADALTQGLTQAQADLQRSAQERQRIIDSARPAPPAQSRSPGGAVDSPASGGSGDADAHAADCQRARDCGGACDKRCADAQTSCIARCPKDAKAYNACWDACLKADPNCGPTCHAACPKMCDSSSRGAR